MFANRRFDWARLFAVWLTLCAASITTGAQEPPKDSGGQLSSIQKKVEVIDSHLAEQGLTLENIVNEQTRKFESIEGHIAEQNRRIGDIVEKQSEEREISIIQRTAQIAPLLSAMIASAAVVVAYFAYRRNKINSAATHMHGVFRDYLKLRLDYHQKLLEKGEKYQQDSTSKCLNNSGETLAQQMAGIQLYALEEIFFWLKERKKKKKNLYLNSCGQRKIYAQSKIYKIHGAIRYRLILRNTRPTLLPAWIFLRSAIV